MMKMLVMAALCALWFTSCAPTTPQGRIQQSPQKFSALPTKHQAIVQQGQITRGMSPDAVYLAWGDPSATFQGSKNGKTTERWDYAGSKPVAVNSFYGGYGYSPYSPYGPYGRHAYYGFGPEVAYVPYRIASVWFIEGHVDSWERAR